MVWFSMLWCGKLVFHVSDIQFLPAENKRPTMTRYGQVQPSTARYNKVRPGKTKFDQVQTSMTKYNQVQTTIHPCSIHQIAF